MNILIVSQHFFPDNFRVNEIAFGLQKRGHAVTVLTSLPDYATGRVPKEYKKASKRDEIINDVRVLRVATVSRRTGFVFRALNYVSFMLSSALKVRSLKDEYDVMFSYQTSPVLMAHAARRAKDRFHKKMFLYCLDLWPECLKAWHVGEQSFLFRLVHKYSKWIYNGADLIAVSSKPFLNYLHVKNGVDPAKMTYLPQHADDMNLPERKRKEEEPLRFAFGGNIGSVQDVECIIKAVELLKDTGGFTVEIYGDGSELQNCKELSNILGTDTMIHFYGRVAKEELVKEYEQVDAFLLTLKQQGAIGDTMPAKLQEYMSGARPIFAAIGGAAAEVIAESGCGFAAPPSDYAGLAENMKKFIKDSAEYSYMGQKGREYYLNHFTETIFLNKLCELLSSLTESAEV